MPEAEPAPVRDAASLVLVRRHGPVPEVLMGQRGSAAAFMPDKFVFPGGAVDPDDLNFGRDLPLQPATARTLMLARATPVLAAALPLAGIRELWEETGLALGVPDACVVADAAPPGWRSFAARGLRPRTEALRFFFRAVTPPGRPRRFDARFFLAEAADLAGADDDFDAASDELGALQWLPLAAARGLALPFITEVVLSEVAAILAAPEVERPVPFFDHAQGASHFRMLRP